MKQHTGMETHDGYAPHSHEIRPDHDGVPGIAGDARQPAPPPAGEYLTPEGHVAEAERLLYVIDEELQSDAPRSLLTLAVVALAHAMTAVAVDEFPPEGEDLTRNLMPGAEQMILGLDPGEDGDAGLALYRTQNPGFEPGLSAATQDISSDTPSLSAAITPPPGLPGTAARSTPLRGRILFWLNGPGVQPEGWTVRVLAVQTGHLDTDVLAELESMENSGLVQQHEPGYWAVTDAGRKG
jgi:hypothetical protein